MHKCNHKWKLLLNIYVKDTRGEKEKVGFSFPFDSKIWKGDCLQMETKLHHALIHKPTSLPVAYFWQLFQLTVGNQNGIRMSNVKYFEKDIYKKKVQ